MTAEESLQMAREAGLLGLDAEGRLERFRKLAYEAGVRAEREACAQVCEELRPGKREYDKRYYDACTACAEVIRGRSNA
jgi:hypothetical protein